MHITPDLLDRIRLVLGDVITINDLRRFDWRRQTDIVHLAFATGFIFATLDRNAALVDGRISSELCSRALANGDVKGFFNRRCHDAGLTGARIIVFDVVSSGSVGGQADSKALIHFHAIFERTRRTNKQLREILRRVFGDADRLGQRQFHITSPDWQLKHSHGNVVASGPLGKLFYALKNAGAAYRLLGLNDEGKRSRKAPPSRADLRASGIAKGIASNFASKIIICDRASLQGGRAAFAAWLAFERELAARWPTEPIPASLEPLTPAVGSSTPAAGKAA